MTPDEAAIALKAAPIDTVPVDDIRMDEALQPRAERVVPYRHRARQAALTEDHVAGLRLVLQVSANTQLDPLLVARIDGQFYVVDGHHRLRAYKLESRNTVPARVRDMTRDDAVKASKVVNSSTNSHHTLAMHEEQRREAAFQYLAIVTVRGCKTLKEAGTNTRAIAGKFQIGKDTVCRMMKKMRTLCLNEFAEEACDPGTNYPLWRYVRDIHSPWRDMQETLTMEQFKQHKAAKLATKFGKLIDEEPDRETLSLALRMLAEERREMEEDRDSIRRLALAVGDADLGEAEF